MKLSGDHQGRSVSPFLEFLINQSKRKDVNSTSQKSDPCMTTNCYCCIDTYAGKLKNQLQENSQNTTRVKQMRSLRNLSGTFQKDSSFDAALIQAQIMNVLATFLTLSQASGKLESTRQTPRRKEAHGGNAILTEPRKQLTPQELAKYPVYLTKRALRKEDDRPRALLFSRCVYLSVT